MQQTPTALATAAALVHRLSAAAAATGWHSSSSSSSSSRSFTRLRSRLRTRRHLAPTLQNKRSDVDSHLPSLEHARPLLLQYDSIVVQRQLEVLTATIGIEQVNRYAIFAHPLSSAADASEARTQNPSAIQPPPQLAWMIERGKSSLWRLLVRNLLRTRRNMEITIHHVENENNVLMHIYRPYRLLLSRAEAADKSGCIVGSVVQRFSIFRRQYDLHDAFGACFARIDRPMLSWDFEVVDNNGNAIACVDRSFGGIARELFTDTGSYSVRFSPSLSPAHRATVLAAAMTIDVDYFSRQSRFFSSFMPFYFFSGGGGDGDGDGDDIEDISI